MIAENGPDAARPKGPSLERILATLLAAVLAAFVILQILWVTRVL